MRNEPKKITLSIDLFFRGVSSKKVQEHLTAFYPHNANHRTILGWIVKLNNSNKWIELIQISKKR